MEVVLRTCACGTVLFDAPTCPTCGSRSLRTSSAVLVLLGLAACSGPRPPETVSDLYGAPPTEEVDTPIVAEPPPQEVGDIYGAPPTNDEPGPLDVGSDVPATEKPPVPKKTPVEPE